METLGRGQTHSTSGTPKPSRACPTSSNYHAGAVAASLAVQELFPWARAVGFYSRGAVRRFPNHRFGNLARRIALVEHAHQFQAISAETLSELPRQILDRRCKRACL